MLNSHLIVSITGPPVFLTSYALWHNTMPVLILYKPACLILVFSLSVTTQDMVGKSTSSGMCSPASSGSFEPTHASAATLLRTEAHSSHPSVRHRSVIGAPAHAPVSYYPQSGPLSLMYPYMAAAQLDGESAVVRSQLVHSRVQSLAARRGLKFTWSVRLGWE